MARTTFTTVVATVRMMASDRAGTKPLISRPGTSGAASTIMDVLMSSESSPKLATVRGSVRTTMMGRTSAFRAAMTADAKRADRKSSTSTPGRSWPRRKSTTACRNHVKSTRRGARWMRSRPSAMLAARLRRTVPPRVMGAA